MREHECGEINSQSTRTKVYKFKYLAENGLVSTTCNRTYLWLPEATHLTNIKTTKSVYTYTRAQLPLWKQLVYKNLVHCTPGKRNENKTLQTDDRYNDNVANQAEAGYGTATRTVHSRVNQQQQQ